MNLRTTARATLGSVALWLWLGAPVASADNAPADPQAAGATPANPGSKLEEMVITARKRAENLQETPISVTAFGAADIEDKGLFRIDDLTAFTPNVQIGAAAGTQNAGRVIIRGISNNDPIGTRDPSVGVYVDGIYLARAQGMLLGLSDIERIEVLRGPQGTLFGRNTIGGAINVITKKPEDRFESDATVRVGSYGLFETRGSVNIPIVPERSAARFSFQTNTRDGYTKNSLTGQRTDDQKLLAARGQLRFTPTDTFEALFTGEQSKSYTSGRGGECRLVPSLVPEFAVPTGEDVVTGGAFSRGCQASAAGDELRYVSPLVSRYRIDTWGLSSTLSWEVAGVTLKSLTSWRRQENSAREDFTFGAVVIGDQRTAKDQQDQITQEFNLGGSALDNRVQWTGGLFGIHEKTAPGLQQTFVAFNLCPFNPAACVASQRSRTAPGTTAYAAYGQATFDVSEQLHVTAGLRRSLEHKTLDFSTQTFTSPTTLGPVVNVNRSERYRKWTPLVSVGYDFTPDLMAYATWSRGFKSGGLNGRPNIALPQTLVPFDQEDLENYEIGMKSSWFDRRLIANVAVFYNNYDNIQSTVLSVDPATGAFASRVANAAKGVIQGAELEFRAVPMAGLDLRAGFGFTDAEYRKFDDTFVSNCAVPGPACKITHVDRSAEPFYGTPNFTASLGAAYTFALGTMGDLTTQLNWAHQNPVNYGLSSSTLKQHKVGVLSGRISLMLPDGKTTLAIFGDNLFDRRYINSGINFEQGFANSVAYFAPPRMWGVEVNRKFE